MVRAYLSLMFGLMTGLALASERIDYSIQFDVLKQEALVEMSLPDGEDATTFWMSAWVPGDYEVFDYGKTITGISFFKDGEEVDLERRNGPNGFVASDEWDKVSYTVRPSRGNFSYNLFVGRNYVWISPAGVLGFAEGRLSQPVSLAVKRVDGWAIHGAIEGRDSERGYVMEAKNHEEIGDSPFVMGANLRVREFRVGGKPHFFVGFGSLAGVDIEAFAAVSELAVQEGLKEFGELPYPRYTFFGEFGNYPAGLEHGTSCRLGFWGKDAKQMSGLIFHEYVHAFNVKAMRPKELRSIDPLNPPVIESLWWLEGVTDYFSDLWRLRAGVISQDEFLREMQSTYSSTLRSQAYSKVSAVESSKRVFEGKGSQGYGGVSYYTKGKVIGFMLDVLVRSGTDGTKSLSDVFKTLYSVYDGGKGFDEHAIFNSLDDTTLPVMGRLITKDRRIYEMINTAQPVPWNEILISAGITEQNGRLMKVEKPTEKQLAIWESLFGKITPD